MLSITSFCRLIKYERSYRRNCDYVKTDKKHRVASNDCTMQLSYFHWIHKCLRQPSVFDKNLTTELQEYSFLDHA